MIILVDPVYNPNNQGQITSATKLGPGVTIAKFLGAYGDKTPFNHVVTNTARQQIARHLYLQAEAMRIINGNTANFNDVRMVVSEGLYKLREGDLNDITMQKKADGRLVYYQVIDQEGKISLEKTFDVAEYLKDYIKFKALYLDYDNYNPDGSLTAQIGIEFPTTPESFDILFDGKVETYFNNHLQSKNELVEIEESD
ncbi:MAG: hypothetical protein CMA07_06200 [Euryarchaeota archaeon]|jgi:hypothetical protein|nr:hypothetical protein [Euryarchaeota archaeon]|tara:strand:- start:609 stop:1202 length:594 start_codon:yes stop_codon:yes gene_type:complete